MQCTRLNYIIAKREHGNLISSKLCVRYIKCMKTEIWPKHSRLEGMMCHETMTVFSTDNCVNRPACMTKFPVTINLHHTVHYFK